MSEIPWEPTMELRIVRGMTPQGLHVVDLTTNKFVEPIIRIEQKWVQKKWGTDSSYVVAEQWRDIPEVP